MANSMLIKLSQEVTKKTKNAPFGTATRLVEKLFSAETPLALAKACGALGLENDVTRSARSVEFSAISTVKALQEGDKETALNAQIDSQIAEQEGIESARSLYDDLQRLKKFAEALANARRKGDEKTREKLLAKFRKGENI